MSELFEVWVVVDTHNEDKESCVVAAFSNEQKLLEFVTRAKPFFNTGRFVINARVNLDPYSSVSLTR